MRGEREEHCLKRVIENYEKWYCYGISYDDLNLLQGILKEVRPNPESSTFPDFVFSNGFIEHFQITSSKVTRKGAVHQREYSQYRRKTDADIEAIQQNMNGNPCFGDVQEWQWSFHQPVHSYEYLKESLMQTWHNHIDSLGKYTGKKQIGIFIIEYPEFALAMCENVYGTIKEGFRYDDLREQQEFNAYRLSRDKEMLDYLYQFSNQIKFVIYVYYDGIEIIKLKNIPDHKKLLPWDFQVCPLTVLNRESLYRMSIPDKPSEIGEKQDE